MELAGFQLSPAEQVRLLQVISGPASAHWRESEKLKFLLAPIIAHSKAEQERFYAIFDQYYAELLAEATDADKAEASGIWLKKLRAGLRKYWWVLPVLLAVVALVYWIINNLPKPHSPQGISIGYSISSTPVRIGDTATFTLTTRNIDTFGAKIRWRLLDKKSGQREVETSGVKNWQLSFDTLKGRPEKIVEVAVYEKRRDTTFQYRGDLTIECPYPPQLEGLDLPGNLPPGETFTFAPNVVDETKDLQFRWDFGDNQSSTERAPTHRYLEEGSYTVELQVTRTGQAGFCTTSTSAIMRVGEDQVFLPWYDLHYDPIRTRATFGWLPWALVFLLAGATFYFLFRWAKTQRPIPPARPEEGQPRGLPLQSADRPPYEIPFRPLNGLIRNLTGQFRLADALRRRQEGLRQEVDVPKTVDVTIASGGFPRLQFSNTTKPADYLFLVDEQNESSHQGRLLRHLVKVLHDQDVHAEVFYYRSEFFHFWNSQYPQGITLEQISRLCPEHRLVVFGDAHALLDPYGQTDKALRPEAVADFQRWKQRLLLTPRPPQSWDFREANIHNLLPIFPADLEGQMAAANFIDNGMAPEDLPITFAAWREKLANSRTEPDINRRWRSVDDHAEYLGYGSDLYRWFCALALYPTPTWEITLTIGAALDIPLNADNLLIMARIPSLQEGKINPRLRKEMLEELDEWDTNIAREAIAIELEAALAEATPGFAHRALQSNLAVQKFALDPYSTDSQAQVKLLLDQGWFNRLHIEDMGGVAAQILAPKRRSRPMTKGGFMEQTAQAEETFESNFVQENMAQQSNMGNFNRLRPTLPADEPTLRRFLEENSEVAQQEVPPIEKPPKPKTINREFWQMIACAAGAMILVWGMMRLDSTDVLYRWAFGAEPIERVYDPTVKLRGNALIKEAILIDSASILNNQAVQLYQEQAFGELQKTASGPSNSPQTYAYPPQVRNLLEQALKVDQTHSSAALNLARLNHNIGVAFYRAARNGSSLQTPDSLALLQFQENDSLVDYFTQKQINSKDLTTFNALHAASKHALGVIFYLINTTNDPSVAEGIHSELQTQGFFDTTSIRPNLATLLQKEPSRIYDILPGSDTETNLQVQVNYYTNPNRDKSLRLRLTALERRAGSSSAVATYVPRQERQAQAKEGNERFTLQSNLIKPGDQRRTDSLRVELVRINPNPRDIAVVAKLTIPYRKTWGKAAQTPEEEVAYFNGRIVDGVTGGLLRSEADVSWEWLYRNNRKIPGRLNSSNGNITIRQTLSRVATLTLRVKAEGYRPYERSFSQAELQRMNGKLPEVRMMVLEQQGIDTRQQQQTNNSARNNYTAIQPEMVRVIGGTFTMGCIDGRDKGCNATVQPAHEVTLSTFFMGKYEVTNAEFAVFLNDINDNPTRINYPSDPVEEHQWGLQKSTDNERTRWVPAKGYDKYPVINVSWAWADAYCKWLSRQTGEKYRLPTEAEWEYAARGGQASLKNRFLYAGSDQIGEVAWYLDNARRTNPVGQKGPNQLDLYDMSGNVYEWCQDWYGPYKAGNQSAPGGPVSGKERVMRGGSFGMFEESIYLVAREKNYPNLSNQNLGFRVARTP
ncbi:MAG: SUMF1/EgtB/PvdO family nonheme iron enzyme [Haliscomenobacter sp.]|uniref:SUMF1/EgtB/PvdO family nonheme iron enzyme n=1 Tax=Haliscomenobacter sp. TaxID=2717303 RepID=UPI0029A441B0|nr:SUMF1/EgtB/PvdO family nonheme iron enzyme [Haliscomenobacter sp.]MDX2071447.1 SUMF1/EgtB/PvdO family nonheme iron enzyme [Haliscomenobacter sp.]